MTDISKSSVAFSQVNSGHNLPVGCGVPVALPKAERKTSKKSSSSWCATPIQNKWMYILLIPLIIAAAALFVWICVKLDNERAAEDDDHRDEGGNNNPPAKVGANVDAKDTKIHHADAITTTTPRRTAKATSFPLKKKDRRGQKKKRLALSRSRVGSV